MPAIDLSILNQRQTPAFFADVFANRPAAGFVGRIFISTDTFIIYRDNGTSWNIIGGGGAGSVTGSGANGQVSFWNGASTITGSNDLFWDSVNGHLGIGTITPGTALDIKHNQNTVLQLEQEVATNDIRIAFINSGVGLWRLGTFYNSGANDFGLFDIAAATQQITIKRTSGNLLVGGIADNGAKLQITGSATISSNFSADGNTLLLGYTTIRNINGGTLSSGMNLANSTSGDARLLFSNTVNGATIGYSSTTNQRILFTDGSGNEIFSVRTGTGQGGNTNIGGTLSVTGIGRFTTRLNAFNATDNALFDFNVNGSIYCAGFSPNQIVYATNQTLTRTNSTAISTGNNLTFTLPSASGINNIFVIKHNGTGTLTVSTSQTIVNMVGASVTSIVLTVGQCVFLQANGNNVYFQLV